MLLPRNGRRIRVAEAPVRAAACTCRASNAASSTPERAVRRHQAVQVRRQFGQADPAGGAPIAGEAAVTAHQQRGGGPEPSSACSRPTSPRLPARASWPRASRASSSIRKRQPGAGEQRDGGEQ
jgi:hypothetical protein